MAFKYRVLILGAVIELGAVFLLEKLGYASIIMPFLILFILIIILLPQSFGRTRYKVDRTNLSIPEKFQAYHQELLALGFELDCLMLMTYYFLPRKQWIYRHKLERAEAYINEETGFLWISSYFDKSFFLSTRFRNGYVIDNRKMVSHVIKTSIPAAFDYHLQHRQKYIGQYGDILFLDSVEEQFEWELNQKLGKEFKWEEFKIFGRLGLAAVILVVMFFLTAIIVHTFLVYSMPERADEMINAWNTGFINLGCLSGIIWTLLPVLRPRTVEERKKKELSKE
jgi:hypothetical protein